MDAKDFMKCAKGFGLTLGKGGFVGNGDYDYCRLLKDGIPLRDGRLLRLTDIASVSFSEGENVLTAIKYNGQGEETFYGFRRSERDEEGDDGEIPMYVMPLTISALNDAFPVIYPDYKQMLYYDELREREMVDMRMFDRPAQIKPLDDSALAIYHDDMERRLVESGFVGSRFPAVATRDEVLTIRVSDNSHNPFREWVESHEWDGKPRLRTVFQNYFGGTAPALRDDENEVSEIETKYLGDVAEAWFIGAIKRMYSKTVHEIVPVFIGGQGLGKGKALTFLAGRDEWYKATTASVDKIDRFLDSVRGSIIVEFSESTQFSKADSGDLKAFISESADQLRKAYARYDKEYPRHFIIAATSNFDGVFVDDTGNRRFYPIYCDPVLQQATGAVIPVNGRPRQYQYEVEQIWAEALVRYRNQGRWYISDRKTVRAAEIMQAYGSVEKEGVSTIEEWLDDPINGYSEPGSRIAKEFIIRDMYGEDPKFPSKESLSAWKHWCSSTMRWSRSPTTFRIDGRTYRGFVRQYSSDQAVVRKTFNLADASACGENGEGEVVLKPSEMIELADSAPRPESMSPVDRFRAHIETHPAIEVEGALQAVDVTGLSRSDIEEFLLEGFLVDYGVGDRHDYRLGYMP